jgi:hypothetical protein
MSKPAITKFEVKLELMPKSGGDYNLICGIIYSEYMIYVRTLEALLMPQTMLRRGLEEGISAVDDFTYNTINKGLGELNTALAKIMPKPFSKTLKMDAGLGVIGNTLALTCTDFLGSMPQELFNIFQDIKYGIKKMSEILMPGNLMNGIAKSLIKMKDDAMKEVLGDLFDTVLSPIIDYQDFLEENGIPELIKKLQKMERCLTKKGICGRPKADFMEPTTHKLWSTYFKSQMLVSSKGTINLKSHGGTSKQKSQMNNITKSMNQFRLTIK